MPGSNVCAMYMEGRSNKPSLTTAMQIIFHMYVHSGFSFEFLHDTRLSEEVCRTSVEEGEKRCILDLVGRTDSIVEIRSAASDRSYLDDTLDQIKEEIEFNETPSSKNREMRARKIVANYVTLFNSWLVKKRS